MRKTHDRCNEENYDDCWYASDKHNHWACYWSDGNLLKLFWSKIFCKLFSLENVQVLRRQAGPYPV